MIVTAISKINTHFNDYAVHKHCRIFKDRQVYPAIDTPFNTQVYWFDNNYGAEVVENESSIDITPIIFRELSPTEVPGVVVDDMDLDELMPFYETEPVKVARRSFSNVKSANRYLRNVMIGEI